MAQVLALGDCNMSGDVKFKNNSYPERFSGCIGKSVKNAGYTMSTTREMQYLFKDHYTKECEIVLIQYGLVDSWKTFKYAPYVLYYPDNPLRKIFRKIVKKYKKIAKALKLNDLLGTQNVVGIEEYKKNIEQIISTVSKKTVILIDTVPNHQLFRNDEIVKYNDVLDKLSKQYNYCYKLDIYNEFLENMDKYYLDETHINDEGYEVITQKLVSLYQSIEESS
ncbi:SGNH/GDSL hydrolase family protein [Sulfurovum sp. ST-21]|uniref:SGNH/GDSL hydrolase family protein n=1 Tax=Sulfurovum indicum TaxID=2779528 RepID=A0A7M1S5I0_9BACT|nr:SGNH/GDSL hydrolase family protein [Sulfurovum indicum]QOR62332.1 SGNH/GDSL hydrolase family protein [Sulfurovum indicum]